MKKDILFLDKDSTLGDWARGESFYPGAVAFLQQQKEREGTVYCYFGRGSRKNTRC